MSGCEYVTLRNGRVIPVPVLSRLWDLEVRGVKFRLDDGGVFAGPRRLLESDDLDFLAEHKSFVVSILTSEARA